MPGFQTTNQMEGGGRALGPHDLTSQLFVDHRGWLTVCRIVYRSNVCLG